MRHTFVTKGLGGTLTHYLSRSIDSGNTPTVTLLQSSGATIVASQNATKGPSTTLDGAAAAGATTVPVAATTSINVGDRLWLINTAGQSEEVVVASVTAGASFTTRNKLKYTYASGDTVASRKVSVAITAEQATTVLKNCQARWAYESGSQAYAEQSTFHISYFSPTCGVTEATILRYDPRVVNYIDASQDLQDIIDEVFYDVVLGRVALLMTPGSLISGSVLDNATKYKVLAELYAMNRKYEDFDKFTELFNAEMEQVFSGDNFDPDQDGAIEINADKARTPWIVRVRRSG